jgi:hypothetical protein
MNKPPISYDRIKEVALIILRLLEADTTLPCNFILDSIAGLPNEKEDILYILISMGILIPDVKNISLSPLGISFRTDIIRGPKDYFNKEFKRLYENNSDIELDIFIMKLKKRFKDKIDKANKDMAELFKDQLKDQDTLLSKFQILVEEPLKSTHHIKEIDTRVHECIYHIEQLWPPDSEYTETRKIGQQLLLKAIEDNNWRELPLSVLERYAELCICKESNNE